MTNACACAPIPAIAGGALATSSCCRSPRRALCCLAAAERVERPALRLRARPCAASGKRCHLSSKPSKERGRRMHRLHYHTVAAGAAPRRSLLYSHAAKRRQGCGGATPEVSSLSPSSEELGQESSEEG